MQRRARHFPGSFLAVLASTTLGACVARVWSNDVATRTRGPRSDVRDSSGVRLAAASAASDYYASLVPQLAEVEDFLSRGRVQHDHQPAPSGDTRPSEAGRSELSPPGGPRPVAARTSGPHKTVVLPVIGASRSVRPPPPARGSSPRPSAVCAGTRPSHRDSASPAGIDNQNNFVNPTAPA